MTSDPFILRTVQHGLELDFIEIPITNEPHELLPTPEEKTIIKLEIEKLLAKKIIIKTTRSPNDFISNVFTREKKYGSVRMILNLKKLNTYIKYQHFKMESIQNVIDILRPNVYMASIDLKDAFYFIPVHTAHKKYFKFVSDNIYQFTCMPNGYGPAMRIFTKVSKVPFSYLRSKGFISVVFVDDSYLKSNTYDSCLQNIEGTIIFILFLGFTIIQINLCSHQHRNSHSKDLLLIQLT